MERYSTWLWVLAIGAVLIVISYSVHTEPAVTIVSGTGGSLVGLGIGALGLICWGNRRWR